MDDDVNGVPWRDHASIEASVNRRKRMANGILVVDDDLFALMNSYLIGDELEVADDNSD